MDQEYQKEIEEIIGEMKCPKDFVCYKSGFEVLCEARSVGDGDESYLLCCEEYPQRCKFVSLNRGYICECSLRIYLAKKLKK
jgi:hypothetical protein